MVQRMEVIVGKERRRRWSTEEKQRLVAATFESGATIAQVARLYDVAESCLYAWRKQFGDEPGAELQASEGPFLVPAMIADDAADVPARPRSPARAVITLIDGTRLEIDADYPPAALRALIGALRRKR